MLASFLSDLYFRNSDSKDSELQFAAKVSKTILIELDQLLATAASLGHRNVLISTVPIVSSLPLARLLVHILVPGCEASFVTQTVNSFGSSINEHLRSQYGFLAKKHGLHSWIFEEGSSLDRLAQQSDASNLGPIAAFQLAFRSVQRILRALTGAAASAVPVHFWRDGHHPAAAAHEQLAAEVQDLLAKMPKVRAVFLMSMLTHFCKLTPGNVVKIQKFSFYFTDGNVVCFSGGYVPK